MAKGKNDNQPKTCPQCNGEGVQYFYGSDGRAKVDTCKGCGGSGKV